MLRRYAALCDLSLEVTLANQTLSPGWCVQEELQTLSTKDIWLEKQNK